MTLVIGDVSHFVSSRDGSLGALRGIKFDSGDETRHSLTLIRIDIDVTVHACAFQLCA